MYCLLNLFSGEECLHITLSVFDGGRWIVHRRIVHRWIVHRWIVHRWIVHISISLSTSYRRHDAYIDIMATPICYTQSYNTLGLSSTYSYVHMSRQTVYPDISTENKYNVHTNPYIEHAWDMTTNKLNIFNKWINTFKLSYLC